MFQEIRIKYSGYTLHDKGLGVWSIQFSCGIFTGNLKQVCTYAVMELGFKMEELEYGVMEMEKSFHNAAEYGVFKRFMWSYDWEEFNAKAIVS